MSDQLKLSQAAVRSYKLKSEDVIMEKDEKLLKLKTNVQAKDEEVQCVSCSSLGRLHQ